MKVYYTDPKKTKRFFTFGLILILVGTILEIVCISYTVKNKIELNGTALSWIMLLPLIATVIGIVLAARNLVREQDFHIFAIDKDNNLYYIEEETSFEEGIHKSIIGLGDYQIINFPKIIYHCFKLRSERKESIRKARDIQYIENYIKRNRQLKVTKAEIVKEEKNSLTVDIIYSSRCLRKVKITKNYYNYKELIERFKDFVEEKRVKNVEKRINNDKRLMKFSMIHYNKCYENQMCLFAFCLIGFLVILGLELKGEYGDEKAFLESTDRVIAMCIGVGLLFVAILQFIYEQLIKLRKFKHYVKQYIIEEHFFYEVNRKVKDQIIRKELYRTIHILRFKESKRKFIIYGDIELIQYNKQRKETSRKIINKLNIMKVFDNQDVLSSYLKEYAKQVD